MEDKPAILIVDDQQTDRESLVKILKKEGYPYIEASAALPALEILKTNNISLILLDLGLPDINGRFIIPQLLELNPDLHIIVVSSTLDMEERLECFKLGAEDFITKPYHDGETLARIKRSLREQESNKSKQVQCGSLTLDRNTRQISCNGKVVDISSKTFDIIYLLALNPGKVYSREKIGQIIWQGFYVSDNSIWVHMNRVKTLLKEYGDGAGRIENHRGTGYCYIPD
jgi:two-component system copper resistance phosphate regulon response regulator CusR